MLIKAKKIDKYKNSVVKPCVFMFGIHDAGPLVGHLDISKGRIFEYDTPALVLDKVRYFSYYEAWGNDINMHSPLVASTGSSHDEYYKILYEESSYFVKVAEVEEYVSI